MNSLGRRLDKLLPWVLARQEARVTEVYRRRERDPEANALAVQSRALLDRFADATPPAWYRVNARLAAYVVRGTGSDPDEFRRFMWQSQLAERTPEGRALVARLREIDARLASEGAP